LHRSGHRQINFERETKWISSKPKQNGPETKPITYNNKQNNRLLITTKKTTDCLQQQTKTIDCLQQKNKNYRLLTTKKQNYRLLTLARNKTTDYLQLQRQPKLVSITCRAQQDWKKLLNHPCCSRNNKTDYLWEQKTTAAWETGERKEEKVVQCWQRRRSAERRLLLFIGSAGSRRNLGRDLRKNVFFSGQFAFP
jgi:hypothetical protein